MEDKDKTDRQTGPEQVGEKNPTLGSPGSNVADYGNTTGGSAVEELEKKHGLQSNRKGNSSIPPEEDINAGT